MNEYTEGQRLDKWLWHTRFVKTRSLAQKLVTEGKVRVEGEKVTSASRKVRAQNVLTLTLPQGVRMIRILDIPARRGPYSVACTFYEDMTPKAPEANEGSNCDQPNSMVKSGRPNKQQRRQIMSLKQNSRN